MVSGGGGQADELCMTRRFPPNLLSEPALAPSRLVLAQGWVPPAQAWGPGVSQFMQVRNWLLVGVSILDQLKDELHLVLVVLD